MSPADHTFSKFIYLDHPDGINIEITLETPERFKECVPGPGNALTFVGADGVGRPGAYALDLAHVLRRTRAHYTERQKSYASDLRQSGTTVKKRI